MLPWLTDDERLVLNKAHTPFSQESKQYKSYRLLQTTKM